jgi:MFS family permease
MLFFGAMFGAWYFETLYMQSVLGFTPIEAGVAFLPQTLLIAVGSQVTSRLIARFGTRTLMVAGSAVAAAGLVWLSTITPDSTFVADLLGPFLLIGAGMGLSVTPVVVAGTSGVEPREAGLASGLLNTSRIVGAAVGLAALSTVAATRTASVLASGASGPGRVATAVTDGYSAGLVIGAVILVAAAAVALLTIPPIRQARRLRAVPTREPQAEPELAVVAIRPGGDGPERESA